MSKIQTAYPLILAVTPGDPAGIGPEIVWKILQSDFLEGKNIALLCIGSIEPFKKFSAPLVIFDPSQGTPKEQIPKKDGPFVWIWPAPKPDDKSFLLEGYQSGWSILQATQLALSNQVAGIVTGPIHKERLKKGGYPYPGHTEFIADLCQTKEVTMMLANDVMRVSLVTTHIAVKDISTHLTQEKIRKTILQTAIGLNSFWGISKPRIAVCALNPHAGDSGLFGREEIEIIEPALKSLLNERSTSFTVEGPFAADTLFAKQSLARESERFDAIVCMYHDQGLIPVKLIDFYRTVNITLGLPIIRTSVDHGVGFDIVNKGIANPSSFCAAIDLATRLTKK